MAHGRRETLTDDRYYGETYLHSEDVSHHHLTENEEMQGPPQNTAPPLSQHLGCAPWNAPPPHLGAQGPCYVVPCANYSAPGNAAWHPTPRILPPVLNHAPRYTDQRAGETGGAIPHQWDSGNLTDTTCVDSPLLAPSPHSNCMSGRCLTPVAYDHSEAGTNMQSYAPRTNAPAPSELLSLARRLILDLGTRVHVLNMEASGRGGLKVTITLETAELWLENEGC
ncbi:hypothetical protein V8E53_010656 [Lactarius tabidus]